MGQFLFVQALAGERACYHSMVSFGSQVLLLGTKSFQVSLFTKSNLTSHNVLT